MGRPSKKTAVEKTRIVLSVLRGDVSVAEAARRNGVSEQSIGNWKQRFLAGGQESMQAGGTKVSSREQLLRLGMMVAVVSRSLSRPSTPCFRAFACSAGFAT